jgi:PhzF family phenazine biosynthesis protein
MKEVRIYQVDAFTEEPFGGNPAGVVLEAESLEDPEMQLIAREMNLSETAFVTSSEKADFRVRFFTPGEEVDLCGHATVGTFHALHEKGFLAPERSVFTQETRAGVLEVERSFREGRSLFTMTQARPRYRDMGDAIEEIVEILNIREEDLMERAPLKISTGLWWLVVGIKELKILQDLAPSMEALRNFSKKYGVVGMVPLSLETLNPERSYHMRAFAPLVGIAEDPVCGTCNGCAGAFLAFHDLLGPGEDVQLESEAGFEVARPGRVRVSLRRENGDVSRIQVGGSGVTVLEGIIKF